MKNNNIFNSDKLPRISGECGYTCKHIDDFSQLTCPVCGERFILKAVELDKDTEKELHIMHTHTYSDDIGQIHTERYGRSICHHYDKVDMYCPNNCVENITFNVKNTTYGRYRELNELK